jgi:transcriptional regulator of acetoin/glycerol metabolism
LFLDEIGDMPLPLQARLLRVLQEREVVPLGAGGPVPVDIAIVCATHRDLRALRATGAFRDDLYWRINGLVVRLPSLRERSDLPAIAQRLLRVDADLAGEAPPGLAADVLDLFARHPWPGNIRQMASLLRTAAALRREASDIAIDDLPEDFLDDLAVGADAPSPRGDPASLQAVAMSAIEQALHRNGGNISAAARSLGVARNTVYRRLRAR